VWNLRSLGDVLAHPKVKAKRWWRVFTDMVAITDPPGTFAHPLDSDEPSACPPHGPDVVQHGHEIVCGRCGEPLISDEEAAVPDGS
jgi:hypothetical protein